jgi:hypothetical protein
MCNIKRAGGSKNGIVGDRRDDITELLCGREMLFPSALLKHGRRLG